MADRVPTEERERDTAREREQRARLRARRERSADRLDQPQERRRRLLPQVPISGERFGVLSEKFARFMGTATFLIWMTVFVAVWLAWNTFMPESTQFDPRELNYTLLTLMLSLQASYAAPLILLAQNRQDDRDRAQAEVDREVNARALADTEFVARELSAVRLTLADVVTAEDLRRAVDRVGEALEELSSRIDAIAPRTPAPTGETDVADTDQAGP